MRTISPFQNESESLSFGGLTVENRADRVTVYGSLDLTRDKRGLQDARELHEIFGKIVRALEMDKSLPDHIPAPKPLKTTKNPFA